jgi:hypothetical protein
MIVWGSAPEWFAAVGTVGALVVSLYLIWNERSLRINQQAKSMAVWAEWDRAVAGQNPRQYFIYINNAGDSPVRAEITRVGKVPYPVIRMGVIPPHDTKNWGLEEDRFPPKGNPPFVEIEFLDLDRVRWQCNSDGVLRKAHERQRHLSKAFDEILRKLGHTG